MVQLIGASLIATTFTVEQSLRFWTQVDLLQARHNRVSQTTDHPSSRNALIVWGFAKTPRSLPVFLEQLAISLGRAFADTIAKAKNPAAQLRNFEHSGAQ
jgi:hypothetical protein